MHGRSVGEDSEPQESKSDVKSHGDTFRIEASQQVRRPIPEACSRTKHFRSTPPDDKSFGCCSKNSFLDDLDAGSTHLSLNDESSNLVGATETQIASRRRRRRPLATSTKARRRRARIARHARRHLTEQDTARRPAATACSARWPPTNGSAFQAQRCRRPRQRRSAARRKERLPHRE